MLKRLTFDLETHLIQPGQIVPKPVAGAVMIFDGKEVKGPVLASVEDITTEVLAAIRNGWLIVGHNVVYDLACLWRANPMIGSAIWDALENGQVSDTLVREKLIKCAEGRLDFDWKWNKQPPKFLLSSLVLEYLGVDISESKENPNAWRLRYSELDGVPLDQWPEEAVQYVIDDVRLTDAVWLHQTPPRAAAGAGPYVTNGRVLNEVEQTRAAWVLFLITAWGLITDPQRVADLELAVNTELVELGKELMERKFIKKNGSKNMSKIKEMVETAYGAKKMVVPRTDPTKKYPDGQVKTDEATLKEVDNPVLNRIIEYSHLQKLGGTFIGPVLKQGINTPIHSNYDVLKATGRTSSYGMGKGSDKMGCNIQQLPRKGGVRECFRPRPGNLFIDCDYSTIELAALAQVCYSMFGYSAMRDALLAGRDLHLVTAASIMGTTVDQLDPSDPQVKEMRQLAKVPNFGFPGGMGPEALTHFAKASYGLTITVDQATELKKAWLRAYPELNNYFQQIAAWTNNDSGEFNLQQLFSDRIRGNCRYTQAANGLFQGLAADGAKHAMWLISRECYLDRASVLYGTRMCAFVHDELLCEAPENMASKAADRLSELMVAGMRVYLPDVPVKAEPALMRYWYKDAETVRDEQGNLCVWEPKE